MRVMRRPTPTSPVSLLPAVRRIVPLGAVLGIAAGAAAAATPVAAHGAIPTEPPTPASLLLGWTFEPLPTIGIAVGLMLWRWAVRRVNAAHPGNPVPRSRTLAFLGGMAAIAIALMSGIDRYDTSLFSVHMVQHVLLTLVAAPLIALSGPITLALRVVSPDTRRTVLLPILHARLTRILAFPVVAWLLLASVMWVTHFSPLFDAALEDPLIHDLEHALYLGAALLFWWPAVARDPAPWRMTHPVRAMYTFLQMSQNTFLAVVLLNVQEVLYHHYATLARPWGLPPLADQQLAAGIMWLTGDLIFLGAIMAILVGWSRAEGRDAARSDRRAATELAEIRIRETRLAERLTRERDETQPGSGVSR
jgi:cytochrome c oxidase assembly factor CtaG